jgi:hypothetical protein
MDFASFLRCRIIKAVCCLCTRIKWFAVHVSLSAYNFGKFLLLSAAIAI